jgi:hypothetical protein
VPTNTPRGQSLVHQSESSINPAASPLPSTVIPQQEVRKKEGASPALKGCLIAGAVILVLAVINSGKSTRSTTTSSPVLKEKPKQWFQGGNLHEATITQWLAAEPSNKLATASDWLAATKWKGHLNKPEDFDKLKIKAQMLADAVDGVVEGNEEVLVNDKARFIAAMIAVKANDLGP